MTAATAKPCKDDFHLERSRFLDAFAALEEALARFGDIADEVRLEDIKRLRTIRNDIVHAQLRFVQMEGQLHVVAINSLQANTRARLARLLTFDDLTSLRGNLARLTKSLEAA